MGVEVAAVALSPQALEFSCQAHSRPPLVCPEKLYRKLQSGRAYQTALRPHRPADQQGGQSDLAHPHGRSVLEPQGRKSAVEGQTVFEEQTHVGEVNGLEPGLFEAAVIKRQGLERDLDLDGRVKQLLISNAFGTVSSSNRLQKDLVPPEAGLLRFYCSLLPEPGGVNYPAVLDCRLALLAVQSLPQLRKKAPPFCTLQSYSDHKPLVLLLRQRPQPQSEAYQKIPRAWWAKVGEQHPGLLISSSSALQSRLADLGNPSSAGNMLQPSCQVKYVYSVFAD